MYANGVDFAKIVSILPLLPDPERIVVELNFRLNGRHPCGLDRIAKKLGRSKYWASVRLDKGSSLAGTQPRKSVKRPELIWAEYHL
jgi:hypothetical protein